MPKHNSIKNIFLKEKYLNQLPNVFCVVKHESEPVWKFATQSRDRDIMPQVMMDSFNLDLEN